MIRIGEYPASSQGAGVRIDPIVHKIHVALMGKSGFIGQPHLGGDLLVTRALALALPAETDVFQDGALIGASVAIQWIERDEGGQQGCARPRDSAADQVSLGDERA